MVDNRPEDERGYDHWLSITVKKSEAQAAEIARLTAELAQARAIADTWRGIANINEVLLESANHDDERSRRTIRALVVAARAMGCVGFVKMGQVRWYAEVRGEIKHSGQQAGE